MFQFHVGVLHRFRQIDLKLPQTPILSLVNFTNKRAFIYYGKLLTNDYTVVWGNLKSIWRNLCTNFSCPTLSTLLILSKEVGIEVSLAEVISKLVPDFLDQMSASDQWRLVAIVVKSFPIGQIDHSLSHQGSQRFPWNHHIIDQG